MRKRQKNEKQKTENYRVIKMTPEVTLNGKVSFSPRVFMTV